MLHLERRNLTFAEAVCCVTNEELVASVYEVGVHAESTNAAWESESTRAKLWVRKRTNSQLMPATGPIVTTSLCSKKPACLTTSEWITNHVGTHQGVVSCIPNRAAVAISREIACGTPDYWVSNFVKNHEMFNVKKTRRPYSANRLVFESNTLSSGVPAFLPEGDAFGLHPADTDEFLDAGISVTLRKDPYASKHEPVKFEDASKRALLCANELAYNMEMVERGLSPCIVAAFFMLAPKDEQVKFDVGSQPLAALSSSHRPTTGDVAALVTVTQISTFSLADLMNAINSAPVKSKQEHLVSVLSGACQDLFACVRSMTQVHQRRAMVKLNLTPESVVFCPKLVASDERWNLEGVGFMPMSVDYLDGVPMITDFNAAFTTRIREESYSPETSYVMHCLLLVAFTRATQGPFVSTVLWKHLLSENDPSGFIKDAKAMQSKTTNAGAFLAVLAASPEMRENADVAKALAEVVSDMDEVVRRGVVSVDGTIGMPATRSMFSKLVSIVSASSCVDTKLFEITDEPDDVEQMHLRVLRELKALRQGESGLG